MLYTIPKRPYQCIVIFDEDKRNNVTEIVKKHNERTVNASRFEFVSSRQEVLRVFQKGGVTQCIALRRTKLKSSYQST